MTTAHTSGELEQRERGQCPDVDDEGHDREEEDHHFGVAERQRQRAQERAPAACGLSRGRSNDSRRARHPPGQIEEIGGAGEFDRDKHPGEGLGDDGEACRGQREPDHVADEIAGDERRETAQSLPEHARDQRRDARPGCRHGGEIDGGEEDERVERHVGRLRLRLARTLSVSTTEEKNIAA